MKFLFIFSYLVSLNLVSASEVTQNEVLFSFGGSSYTSYDKKLYSAVLNEVFQKNNLFKLLTNDDQDFLFYTICLKEADTFQVLGSDIKLSDAAKKSLTVYSQQELANETAKISKVLSYLEVRQKQMNEPSRFKSWYELLKRKYQIKTKSASFKNANL